MRLILASGSPRRKEILSRNNIEFEIIKSVKDEETDKTEPGDIVKDLSKSKAMEVLGKISEANDDGEVIILGADTIVYADNKVLGKPVDRTDAFAMIKLLSGSVHSVYTGITVVKHSNGKTVVDSFYEKTDVYVKALTDDEIYEYVTTGECDDKAGAYAIQGIFSKYVDHIEGDFSNVVGLPEERTIKKLKEMGL